MLKFAQLLYAGTQQARRQRLGRVDARAEACEARLVRVVILQTEGAGRVKRALQLLMNRPLCSGTCASFDSGFRRFDYRKLEVESLRRTGHL